MAVWRSMLRQGMRRSVGKPHIFRCHQSEVMMLFAQAGNEGLLGWLVLFGLGLLAVNWIAQKYANPRREHERRVEALLSEIRDILKGRG